MIRATARAPTSSGASAISPCGASVTLNTATTIATAAGHSRRVAMAFSTSTHAASAPNAMSGSGRRPLLNGSHAARNTAPAVHTATRLVASRLPSRGSTQRLMISQVAMAAAVAGSRIHTPGGADRRQVGEHATGTSRTAPRWRRRSGSSWRVYPASPDTRAIVRL